jgi:hypothetical protein
LDKIGAIIFAEIIGMKKNELILRFGIYGFNDVAHDMITQSLNIEPDYVRIKGQKKNSKNPESTATIDTNSWLMGSGLDQYSSFDDQMNSLLDIIESKIDLFKPLCEKYHCEFSCGIFVYFDNGESTPGVHLDSRYNKILKELNIEFDVDLYVLPAN